ncbi:20641_t:CDS:1, partial [Funneliformis geosporum]
QKISNQEELEQSEEDENSGENVTIPEESPEKQDENLGEFPEEQTSRAISEKSGIPEKNSSETSEEFLESPEKQTSKRKRAKKTIENMPKGKHIRYF